MTYSNSQTAPINEHVGGVVHKEEHNHVDDAKERNQFILDAVAILDGTSYWLQRDPGNLVAHGCQTVDKQLKVPISVQFVSRLILIVLVCHASISACLVFVFD